MYYGHNEPVMFSRDCDAVMIPSGDEVTLPEGVSGFLTQSLGGSFTIYIEGNLFRIAGVDADAIGKEPIRPPEVPPNATEEELETVIWSQLRTCYDPEIPINIVDLGLIYSCELLPGSSPQERIVNVEMTLTAPGCGMGDILAQDVRDKLEIIPTIMAANVDLTFDPPWNQSMMSEVALLEAGML
ncbi:MAG: putative Fe-S cluster assembly protein SufT [Proteobacteria bacterium]|nr:putative Fe-S cluster assembly protein SufT [Pseudomonadota bacterium]